MSAVSGPDTTPVAALDERYRRFVLSRHGAPLLHCYEATSFLARLRGLHALSVLGPRDALLIRPCRAVQTWRMPYAIDVAFLARDGRILKLRHAVRGTSAGCWQAHMVLEMAAGTASRLGLGTGQVLALDQERRS